jgi:hypothetical protein
MAPCCSCVVSSGFLLHQHRRRLYDSRSVNLVTAWSYGTNRQIAPYEAIVARTPFSSPTRPRLADVPATRFAFSFPPGHGRGESRRGGGARRGFLELALRYGRITRARLDRAEIDREVGWLTVPELSLPTMLPSDALTAPPSAAAYEAIVAHTPSRRLRGHGSQPFQQPAPRLRSRPDMAAAKHVEVAAHVEVSSSSPCATGASRVRGSITRSSIARLAGSRSPNCCCRRCCRATHSLLRRQPRRRSARRPAVVAEVRR